MDFVTDIAQIEADEEPEEPPKNKVDAFWKWLVGFAISSASILSSHAFCSRYDMYRETIYSLLASVGGFSQHRTYPVYTLSYIPCELGNIWSLKFSFF